MPFIIKIDTASLLMDQFIKFGRGNQFSYTALEQHLSNINRPNLQSGASIDTLVETLLMLTDAALPVILRSFPAGSEAMTNAITELDSSLLQLWSELQAFFPGRPGPDPGNRGFL